MPTKAQLISDIELQVYQGAISDDANLEKTQVAFWISEAINALAANEINEKIKRQEPIPACYIKRAELEVPELDEEDSRIYLELEEDFLTVNKTMGIVRVITDEGDPILRASVETLDILNTLRWTKASENNIIFYPQAPRRLYLEGLKEVDLPFNSVYVFYVPKQDVEALADTDEVLVSDMTLPLVVQTVVAKAKAEIYGGQEDKNNNGVSDAQPIYHQQIRQPE
jgi:hypothetical protein